MNLLLMTKLAVSTLASYLIFVAAMIRIAGVKSNDKINFTEFKDFFYKID